MFSARLPLRLSENNLTAVIREHRQAGRPLLDLTVSNPTSAGIAYPVDTVAGLADPRSLRYVPEPFGLYEARQALVASEVRLAQIGAEQIVLTASTSEAYSFLFKLLCDPGDAVLVPRPSYPLFDLLTGLDAVRPVPYRLDRDGHWCLDRGSIERACSSRTKAVLIVSPNNPTGSCLRRDDRDWLVELAARRNLALIADEVFADYPIAPRSQAVSLAGETRVLTFTLGGLSKSAGLPQMKLAWTAVSGPPALVASALERLAVIADSYLSVSAPVQIALPHLLAAGRAVQPAIRARLAQNYAALRDRVRRLPSVTVYEPEGGWSVLVRVPAILSDEELVTRLVRSRGIVVHPGYLFDLEEDGFLVISLLPQPQDFATGVESMLDFIAEIAS